MSEKGKFWMVYCEGGESPKQKHDSLDKAISEAHRITRRMGRNTSVLQCVGYCEIPVPEPVYTAVKNEAEVPISWGD